MLALYRCGNPMVPNEGDEGPRWTEGQVEALREFSRLRRSLGEVGLEPSADTLELERAIVLRPQELDWTGPDSIAY